MNKWRKRIYMGIIMVALGVTFSTTLSESVGSLGVVFIAIGGLFLISGMAEKRKEDKNR